MKIRTNFNCCVCVFQVSALFLLCFLFNWLANLLRLPFPGSIIALGVLLVLLFVGLLPSMAIEKGADCLLHELLLFFIPPCVSLLGHKSMFADYWLPVIVILVVGTGLIMGVTAFVVERVFKFELRRIELHKRIA